MSEMRIHSTSIKGRRPNNEDRENIILNINGDNEKHNNINLFALYDGHAGTFVSEYLKDNLPRYYLNPKLKYPLKTQNHEKIFEHIQDNLLKYEQGYECGSTCLLALMYKYDNSYNINVVNLGDCRCVIVYNNNNTKQITVDHKPDEFNENKRLKKIGGDVYKDSEGTVRIGNLSLSRAFGDGDTSPYISQKPDSFYFKITEQTKYIILACDGLWDVIENEQLPNIIKKYKNSNENNMAVYLANYALKNGSTDNVSVIVLEIVI
jgi:serine/threonine protein phosphatase PrpC